MPPSPPPPRRLLLLLPVFNDWKALEILLPMVGQSIRGTVPPPDVLIVDDASTLPAPASPAAAADGGPPEGLGVIHKLRLRRNLGHQRAIAMGLAYAVEHWPEHDLLVMDADGEDDPEDIPRLLRAADAEGGEHIVFAERTKRSESLVFRFFYHLYRWLHLLLTGQGVRFGNFSLVPPGLARQLSVSSELWNHYAAAIVRTRLPYRYVPTQRKKRLSGQGQMNFSALVVHGLSALSIFGDLIGARLLSVAAGLLIGGGGLFAAAAALTRLLTGHIPPALWIGGAVALIILVQFLVLSIVFTFIILAGRQSPGFVPIRDHTYFIDRVEPWSGSAPTP